MYTVCICINVAVDQSPLCYKPLSHPAVSNPLSRISFGYDYTYYLKVALCFWGVVGRGLSQNIPVCYKPVSQNGRPSLLKTPMFVIRCHIHVDTYCHVYVYILTPPRTPNSSADGANVCTRYRNCPRTTSSPTGRLSRPLDGHKPVWAPQV